MLARRLLPRACNALSARGFAAVGDKFPAVALDSGFPPQQVNMAERPAGKTTSGVGLPGAVTPVGSAKQVPGYLAKQAELKAKGVSEVIVYCVNDGAVMEGWAKDQKIDGSMVSFLADTRSELTQALDLVLDGVPVLGNPRCKRFALVVDNGVIKAMTVAGGDVPDEATFAEAMLEKC
jgi:2-Cys peroxiredoxin 5